MNVGEWAVCWSLVGWIERRRARQYTGQLFSEIVFLKSLDCISCAVDPQA